MKKFYFIFTCILMFCVMSCTCSKQEEIKEDVKVEDLVKADYAYIDSLYNHYSFYEVTAKFENYFDSESTNSIIETLNSVFQVITQIDSTSADVEVLTFAHILGQKDTLIVEHGFWIEDYPMNDENIVITFEEAYNKMMSANCVKPHSKMCVLRKEVGPIDANVQYIFGNQQAQVYVDAVTGNVSLVNPVFPNTEE